jgi:uncharacterized integral membrane protein
MRWRRGRPREETWQARLYLKLLLLLLATAYAAAFVIENHRETRVHFVFQTARVSLIWLILLCLALGMLGGVLLSQLYRRRRRHERREEPDAVGDLGDGDEAVGEPEGASPST